MKAFQDYVELYLPDKTAPRIYERFSDRWEVCITPSDGQFHQVCCSFAQSPRMLHAATVRDPACDQPEKDQVIIAVMPLLQHVSGHAGTE